MPLYEPDVSILGNDYDQRVVEFMTESVGGTVARSDPFARFGFRYVTFNIQGTVDRFDCIEVSRDQPSEAEQFPSFGHDDSAVGLR